MLPIEKKFEKLLAQIKFRNTQYLSLHTTNILNYCPIIFFPQNFRLTSQTISFHGISQGNEIYLAVPISTPSKTWQVILGYMVLDTRKNSWSD